MKIKVTNIAIYDLDDQELLKEYLEWIDDYEATFENLKEFIMDRFINPNFDQASTTSFELYPEMPFRGGQFE